MEPVNSMGMKEVLRAASQYHHNSGRLTYLLHQLEALETASARSAYIRQLHTHDQIELTECLTFLVDVVREEESQPELEHRVVKILLNLSHDENVRMMLHQTYHLCPSLAALVFSGTTDENVQAQSIQLLQRITYGHRISYHEPYVDNLLKCLINHIMSNNEEFLSPALGTLANLCRNNSLTQSAIRNTSHFKKLKKILCGLFGHENQTVVIFSLSIFTSVILHESEGKEIFFESGNVEQTLQTIFNILIGGVRGVAWRYAADLLTDLLRHNHIQTCVVKYRHLTTCIHDVLSLLAASTDDSMAEVFQLLLAMCSLPSVRHLVNMKLFSTLAQDQLPPETLSVAMKQPLTSSSEPLLCCLHWAAHSSGPNGDAVSCAALDFLTDSVQACLCEETAPIPVHRIAHTVTSLLPAPQPHPSDISTFSTSLSHPASQTIRVVKLLIVMCSDAQSKECLAKLVTKEVISSIVLQEINKSYLSYAAATSHLTNPGDKGEKGTEYTLLTLDLALRLRKSSPVLQDYLLSVLKDPRLMDFLSLGLTSTNQELVDIALRLLCLTLGVEDARPDVVLCNSIACLNKQRQELTSKSDSPAEKPVPNHIPVGNRQVFESKENKLHPLLSSTPVPGDNKQSDESSLHSVIERMEASIETKDVKTANIIEVFEHRLKAQQIKEEHLNDLLEAKTLALAQADRLISQLRGRQAAHGAETKKLQNILKDSERRKEQTVSQMNDDRMMAEKVMAEMEKQLEAKAQEIEMLISKNSDVEEKSVELQDTIKSLKQEIKTLSSIKDGLQSSHEKLKEDYNVLLNQTKELEEERKSLSKHLKERETSLQKISSTLQSLQAKYNDTEKERAELEREKEEIEGYVDKLRSQLSSSENKFKQLQQRATSLDEVNKSQEDKLQEKTQKISDLEAELEKHSQIVSFINNLHLKSDAAKK